MDFIARIKFSDIAKYVKNRQNIIVGFSAIDLLSKNCDIPNHQIEFITISPSKDQQNLDDRISGLTFQQVNNKTFIKYNNEVLSIMYHLTDSMNTILNNHTISKSEFKVLKLKWIIPMMIAYMEQDKYDAQTRCQYYKFLESLVANINVIKSKPKEDIQLPKIGNFARQNDLISCGHLVQQEIDYEHPFPFYMFLSKTPGVHSTMLVDLLSDTEYDSRKFTYQESKYIYQVYHKQTNKDIAYFIKCDDNECHNYMLTDSNLRMANVHIISKLLFFTYFTLRKFISIDEMLTYIQFLITSECG